MLAYIYHAFFRVGGGGEAGVEGYFRYYPVTAKIILSCWNHMWKDLKRAI